MKYAAVIAAAGLSSRMHEFKPMLCLGDSTVITRLIRTLREAGVDEIVVVTGYKSEILRRHLCTLPVRICENENYARTKMFDSILLGLQALQSDYDGVFVMPGDVPLVSVETIRALQAGGAEAARPSCQGKPGHLVLLRRSVIPRLLQYDGPGGLRGALGFLFGSVETLEVDDIGCTMDVDTPEDYQMLRRLDMELHSGGRLWPDVQVRIAKGGMILTPQTAQYLEMIAHTGSIQSACACMHMSYSKGWRQLNQTEQELGYPLVRRTSGGTSGGGTELTEKGRALLRAYQDFREKMQAAAERCFEETFPPELRQ